MKRQLKIVLLVMISCVMLLMMMSFNAQATSVNRYIIARHLSPVKISTQIWRGFPRYKYRHGKGKPEGVVVHETGNPHSTIFDEIAYMKKNYRNAFVHTFVDSSHIINIASTNYLCWGVGYPGNARFVQFEQVEMHSKASFAHEVENAAYYTAYILRKYHLKPNDAAYDGKGTVWSHNAVAKYLGGSDHTDPVGYYKRAGRKYFHKAYTMSQFYKLVLRNYRRK
ncbi:N-acetylmuramoyl-L-alanine amidase family protein [Lentilactobacillus raoultii]|uniref:N-acetylmuramoyl-L-alanine amidase family protein n=1 Tax=Lentilactobacillus raoultii TaxID=1987503 RepID=A0ABW3PTE8_9LACO